MSSDRIATNLMPALNFVAILSDDIEVIITRYQPRGSSESSSL